jgi:tetratricopeptide (TPR) repeat protein
MNGQKSKAWLLVLVLLAGFAGIWRLQHTIDVVRTALHQEQDDLVLRSGPMLKMMSLEYAPLAAELYWTRVVQYYGGKQAQAQARRESNVDLLWPLLDVTTTLDPNLIVAYRFGSTFLSEPPPRGAGRPDLGIKLIERGIQENPDYWRLYEDLGFIYYFNLKDYKKASEAFLEGSKNPHAMIWMKTFAARIAEQGENRQTSAMLWSEVYSSATDPDIKKNAQTHLALLKAQADCEQLDKIAEEYRKRAGHSPATMRDLVNAGMIQGAAVDSEGYVYTFDQNGKAQLNPASPLFKQQPVDKKP